MRLEPQDEYLHPLGPEPSFNESMYFNLFDPSRRLGGFFRLGNRANEGTGEMTACLYLPDGRVAVILRETPFYVESGGQISDRGEIQGEGWHVDVDEVRKIDGRIAALGKVTGKVELGKARATVPRDRRRDTERNHTATHLLHAALRQVLGEHVHQAGSLVAPDRLRFDFAHHGPLSPQQLSDVEGLVNRDILEGIQVIFEEKPKAEADRTTRTLGSPWRLTVSG